MTGAGLALMFQTDGSQRNCLSMARGRGTSVLVPGSPHQASSQGSSDALGSSLCSKSRRPGSRSYRATEGTGLALVGLTCLLGACLRPAPGLRSAGGGSPGVLTFLLASHVAPHSHPPGSLSAVSSVYRRLWEVRPALYPKDSAVGPGKE